MSNVIKNLYYKIRYDFPLWVDNQFGLPWLRILKHRFFTDSFESQKKAVTRLFQIASGNATFDLDNPRTFNEKIQWLKIYWRNPLITQCADKVLVRDYIKNQIGEEYLVDVISTFDSPAQINYDALPDKFALKVNWGSGQNIICTDKSKLDTHQCNKKLQKWLNPLRNHYYFALEWGYKNIPPKIICEKYIDFLADNPKVYKIMCFNGKPKIIQLVMDDKTSEETINYYDSNWNLLPFKQNYPNNSQEIAPPKQLIKLLELSEKLCQPFPFVRVDFFEGNEKIIFSEMTFYSDAGTAMFQPREWDMILGDYLILPEPYLETVQK